MEEKWLVVKKEQSNSDFFDFDLTALILPIAIIAGLAAVLIPMRQQAQAQTQALQAQVYSGNEDPRTLHVTNLLQWINLIYGYPFKPWISAYFINDGPGTVEIGINYPDDRFTIRPNETITVTRSGAEERIKIIFFKSYPGLRSTVRVTGVY